MSSFTSDPIADFHRYDAEQQQKLSELPVCSDCYEPIQGEHYFEFDCYFYCEDCLVNNHRKWVEDYVG